MLTLLFIEAIKARGTQPFHPSGGWMYHILYMGAFKKCKLSSNPEQGDQKNAHLDHLRDGPEAGSHCTTILKHLLPVVAFRALLYSLKTMSGLSLKMHQFCFKKGVYLEAPIQICFSWLCLILPPPLCP